MKKVWVILFDNSPECGSPIRIRGVYDSEEKARKGFEKCLRESWEDLTEDENECDRSCHGDFNVCVKDMCFENTHYLLNVEVWNVNEDWESSVFDGY